MNKRTTLYHWTKIVNKQRFCRKKPWYFFFKNLGIFFYFLLYSYQIQLCNLSYKEETCLILYFIAIHFSYGSVDHPVQEKKICSTYSTGDHNYRSTTTCKRMPLKTKPTYYVGKGASYRRRHLLSKILSSVEEQDSISHYTRIIINHVIIAFRTTSGWCMKDNYNEWQRCCTQNLTGPVVNG